MDASTQRNATPGSNQAGPRTAAGGNLPSGQWNRFVELAELFEEAWKEAPPGVERLNLHDFLPKPDDPLRPETLREFIKIDMEARCRRKQLVSIEPYLREFPELGGRDVVPPEVVYEEYRIRQIFGDKPPLGGYEARFPAQFSRLQQLAIEYPIPEGSRPSEVSAAKETVTRHTKDAGQAGVAPSEGSLDLGEGYRRVKFLGRGGFGEVWRAEAPGGIPCAVKIINRPLGHEEAQRELQSLELIKRLSHPFLLQTQLFKSFDDRILIVMELADCSLRDRLKEGRKAGRTGVPPDELIAYFRETAEALDYLHSERVLHRDIKPDNILLLKRHAKLADFGLARLHESSHMVSVSGSGTPAYMAPEAWQGKASERSDQYSLAITYVELRLDRRPFSSADMMTMMLQHVQNEPDLDPLVSPETDVLKKALAKSPADRFGSCTEFIDALHQALAHVLSPTAPDVELGPDGKRRLNIRPPSGQITDLETHTRRPAPGPADSSGLGGLLQPRPQPIKQQELVSVLSGRAAEHGDLVETRSPAGVVVQKGWHEEPEVLRPAPGPRPPSKVLALLVGVAAFTALGLGVMLVLRSWTRSPTPVAPASRPADEVSFLPARAVPGKPADLQTVDGNRYYGAVDVKLDDGTLIPFVLVPRNMKVRTDTFYIMKNKVSVELFAKFAAAHEAARASSGLKPLGSSWKQGGVIGGKPTNNADPHHPVFNVTMPDAQRFAAWLGGDLPSAAEWDVASGRYADNPGEGPYSGSWNRDRPLRIAVKRGQAGPMAVGEAADDLSTPFGLTDMSGNGMEWTRTLAADIRHERPTPDTVYGPNDLIALRGQEYFRPDPWKFKDQPPAGKAPKDPSPYVSFRVVIPCP